MSGEGSLRGDSLVSVYSTIEHTASSSQQRQRLVPVPPPSSQDRRPEQAVIFLSQKWQILRAFLQPASRQASHFPPACPVTVHVPMVAAFKKERTPCRLIPERHLKMVFTRTRLQSPEAVLTCPDTSLDVTS